MSVTVTVEAPDLVVRVGGVDALLALRREVRAPLHAVVSVHVGRAPLPRGLRAPGTAWPFRPGRVIAGTFRGRRGREFHVVRRGDRALVVDLAGRPWRRLVLEMDDPDGVAQTIRDATGGP